jgi:hypothetical protein
MKSTAMQKLQVNLPCTLENHASYKADVYVVPPMTHPISIARQQASKAPTYSDLPAYLLTHFMLHTMQCLGKKDLFRQ